LNKEEEAEGLKQIIYMDEREKEREGIN